MRVTNTHRVIILLLWGMTVILAGCAQGESPDAEELPGETVQPSETLVVQDATATATQTVTPIMPSPTSTNTPTITATFTPAPTPTETPFPPVIQDESGAWMVLVPAGEFIMGSKGLSKIEEPIHTVYLDDFYIDQYEVTFEQYARFLNEEGNQFEGLANWIEANDPDLRVHEVDGTWQVEAGFENYPMNEMTWYGARAFCVWRGGRLPTEAEWEKAARGTDGRLYPWGDEADCSKANFYGCKRA
jgi:formylglycine-generating enzyme required for sulfatase activity